MQTIQPTAVRYIKLGPGGAWLRRCLAEGLVELDYRAAPHALARAGDWEAVESIFATSNPAPGKAKSFRREIEDFYRLGEDCLWVTIGDGRLWWTFAQAEVFAVDEEGRGVRARRCAGDGWRGDDIGGDPLALSSLSSRLTKVAAYQQTICRIAAEDYLIRRINGQEEPAVVAAREAKTAMTIAAMPLIKALDWRDFELLTDLIFAASGWRRTSAVGGSDQADTDLIYEQAVTGERAFVQVKSAASAAVLRDYIARFRADPTFDRMFFVCHSPSGAMTSEPGVHLWLGETLADQAVRAGLFDWLIAKAR